MSTLYTIPLEKTGNKDIALVGGKNASLGELLNQLGPVGIQIPGGFATTANAFDLFIQVNGLEKKLKAVLEKLDSVHFANLNETAAEAKNLVLNAVMPDEFKKEIALQYDLMCRQYNRLVEVAVRSSATAEDLPHASFAGQHESFLNVQGSDAVIHAVQKCFASLYNARAIKYRFDNGFAHTKIALSAGIQFMVRSDKGCAGVCFTLEPESGFSNVILINGSWGLGENVVQGTVNPDEFIVYKPSLKTNKRCILSKRVGSKTTMLVYGNEGNKLVNIDTPAALRDQLVLNNTEIEQLAKWSMLIEEHYQCPMDIEWAKDGITNGLYIVQARPETVHSVKNPYIRKEYTLKKPGKALLTGTAVGSGMATGIARILHSPADAYKLKKGEILVTDITNPDWDPILKKAAAIITNKGGRTSHAAIVAREAGAVAVVGVGNATEVIRDGQNITVSTIQGKTGTIYEGILEWDETVIDLQHINIPKTAPMLILGDPDQAYRLSFYPCKGVGLMRLEFVISHNIRIHPLALVHYDQLEDKKAKQEIEAITTGYTSKTEYFVDKLSQAVSTIAAAFYPREVIVRMSDFKTNEYASLIGGQPFEPAEENPMIGFRGASRYYHDLYREGFRLECEALKRVRNEMGFDNVKLMIPFCRTVEEGKKVIQLMRNYGLKQGDNGLSIYVMAEVPSNIILADEFSGIFDGFSIGSNDLTQLTLGIDRDSNIISPLFDENNRAVKTLIAQLIQETHRQKVKVGLCGQAPSDDPVFAAFLVEQGIDSISFNPDALLKGIDNMLKAEKKIHQMMNTPLS